MRLCYGLLLASVAACGSSTSDSSSPPPPPPPAPPPVANVGMTDNNGLAPYRFSPETLTVTVGTIVKWTNNGNAAHTTANDASPTPIWNSGSVNPAGTTMCAPNDPYCQPAGTAAGTYQRTFSTAGTYPYHCEIHGLQGMKGVVVVTP